MKDNRRQDLKPRTTLFKLTPFNNTNSNIYGEYLNQQETPKSNKFKPFEEES
jgi:hypothetical protein